jgi:hypothetical protein
MYSTLGLLKCVLIVGDIFSFLNIMDQKVSDKRKHVVLYFSNYFYFYFVTTQRTFLLKKIRKPKNIKTLALILYIW